MFFYRKLIGGHYCFLGWSLMSQNEWIFAIFLTSECKLYLSKVEYFKVFSKKKVVTNTPPPISSHWSDTPSTAAVKSKQRTSQSHTEARIMHRLFYIDRHRAYEFVACVYEELRQICACQSVIDVTELWA